MNVKIKKLVPEAIIPAYAKFGDAGMDLVATSINNEESEYVEYGTGLAMEIPHDHVGLLFPRSSVSKYDLQLCNSVGVVDSNYRGEVKLRFRRILNPIRTEQAVDENQTDDMLFFHQYEIGDKIGQIIILPYPNITFKEVSELSETNRGAGGFGSTGK